MNRYDYRCRVLLAVLLPLFIGGIAVINAATPDRTLSESENRILEQLPTFSMRSLLSGTFTSDYETYVSDQFAFRDRWIGLKTDTDRAMGKRDSNGIYLGKDGSLFQSFTPPSEETVESNIAALHSFDDATPGVRKYAMLAPTAIALYEDRLPAFAPSGNEMAYADRVRQALPTIHFVDLYPVLYAMRDQSIYYKTDHHWTTKGAFAAYRELCKRMGVVPKSEGDFQIRRVTTAFYGTLSSKSGYKRIQPDSIELYMPKNEAEYTVTYVNEGRSTQSLYAPEHLERKDKYAVFLGGNHPLVRITTNNREGTKLLIVKDSYANSLIPFLTEHFSEIYVVDLRYYDEDLTNLIREHDIQEMVLLYNVHTFFEDPFIRNLSEVNS